MADEKNKKGLGRGLMSLFGDQTNESPKKQDLDTSYLSISIGDLERNQYQPRNYFDEKKIDELAQSIKKNGLIQPIAVRKGKKDGYEIIAGERRWMAAQKAGLHEVPVIVLDLNDNQSLELAIIENIPVFPGCEKGTKAEKKACFSKKISRHINRKFNSGLASDLGLSAGKKRIFVMFKIDKTGSITEIQARAPHPRLQKEAERVVKTLPKMIPGKQRGRPVSVRYSLPIAFLVE